MTAAMAIAASNSEPPLVEVRELRQWFPVGGGLLRRREMLRAVDDVSFSIARGEVLGLVGESGSGKSTLGRALLRMSEPTDGQILFEGRDMTRLGRSALRPIRPRMQFIFQDPFASLNPRMTVRQIVGAPLIIQHAGLDASARDARIGEVLSTVGLSRAPSRSLSA